MLIQYTCLNKSFKLLQKIELQYVSINTKLLKKKKQLSETQSSKNNCLKKENEDELLAVFAKTKNESNQ